MLPLPHRILLLLMMAWLPFCCCQASEAVYMLVRGAHAVSVEPASTDPGCHRSVSCCAAARMAQQSTLDAAKPASDLAHAAPGDRHNLPNGPCEEGSGCCTPCKDRTLPAQVSVPAPDTIGVSLAAWICPADALTDAPVAVRLARANRQTGPPEPPGGRALLQRACVLMV